MLRLSSEIPKTEENVEMLQRYLSVSLNRLGDIEKVERKLSEAREYYAEGLEIARQLAQETHTVEARKDLSISLNRLGDTAEAEGNLSEAREYYTESLEIARQLAKETDMLQSYDDLAVSFYNCALVDEKKP